MIRCLSLIALLLLCLPYSQGKKLKLSLPSPKPSQEEYTSGSFCVSSDCEECHEGYSIKMVTFSGYDKPATADKETIFITNNTDRELTSVSFYINYKDINGSQLHKRLVNLQVNIPAGETRIAIFKSWDLQKSFRYKKSRETRRDSYSYSVEIDPVSIYLKF